LKECQKYNNTMKRIFFCLFASMFVIFAACGSKDKAVTVEKSFVELNGKLSVQGTHMVNESGDTVVLRGVSFGWHNFHPRFYTDSAVETLVSDWKCNVVRASMGVGPDRSYLQEPEFGIESVTTVVDAAIKYGVYAIIDFHSHKIHLNEAKTFFTQMAEKYKGVPNVIYEIYNEPDDTYGWKEVKDYSVEVISTIRAIDSTNIILIGSPRWDQEIQLAAADRIEGFSNLMYTMHFYAGTHKQWLRDRTDSVMAAGLPIFVSECAGMEATGDGPIDYKEWPAFLNWMEAKKISWVVWSLSDKSETCSMLTKDASSKGRGPDEVIIEWGLISRTAIRKGNIKE
jgi:endoglucanase